TASVLTSIAVALAFLSARQRLPRGRATLVAAGLGLGTGFWSTTSQTLWQTETVVFGLMMAVAACAAPRERIGTSGALAIGIGLGLAGTTRPQLAPIVGILLAATWLRTSVIRATAATLVVLTMAALLCVVNVRWFGHPLGALPALQDLNAAVH